MKHPPEAFRSARLFDSGCGYLVISRFKADDCVETGFFLLDVFCLGVKDAGFHRFKSVADYQESLLDRLFRDEQPVRMMPAAARKLAEDAVGYARALGFSPAVDYKKASRVFGGITTAECDEEFVFGKDGKPFYIQGPSDSSTRAERILRALEARCGEGGYTTSWPLMTLSRSTAKRKAANAPSPVSSVEQAWRRWPPGSKPSRAGVAVRINPRAPKSF